MKLFVVAAAVALITVAGRAWLGRGHQCTHGASSYAAEVRGGHLTTIRPVHNTGCVR